MNLESLNFFVLANNANPRGKPQEMAQATASGLNVTASIHKNDWVKVCRIFIPNEA